MARSLNMTPQARLLFAHMDRTGSISAREAMADYGITSASLARRVCDMEQHGIAIVRSIKTHPITGKQYTRYSIDIEANK
ncbi:helix-turn-helix domain-containing protein [Martelella mangrovi]